MNFAMGKGVTIVAAAGNEVDDIGNPTVDNISPDDGTPIIGRDVSKNCFVVPSMVHGVYTVSSVSNRNFKSFYSSYGMPWVQATAPGGDSRYFDKSPNVPNGRVLSTYPASLYDAFMAPPRPAHRGVKICDENGQCATYVYHQGTSMASPHVVGVAALIVSRFGHQDPETMTKLLNAATNQIPCPLVQPTPLPDELGPDGKPAHCTGTLAYNSFYGHGQIDALKAVTGEPDHRN
jgi:lantibiotic leader peptide-processing serine protease